MMRSPRVVALVALALAMGMAVVLVHGSTISNYWNEIPNNDGAYNNMNNVGNVFSASQNGLVTAIAGIGQLDGLFELMQIWVNISGTPHIAGTCSISQGSTPAGANGWRSCSLATPVRVMAGEKFVVAQLHTTESAFAIYDLATNSFGVERNGLTAWQGVRTTGPSTTANPMYPDFWLQLTATDLTFQPDQTVTASLPIVSGAPSAAVCGAPTVVSTTLNVLSSGVPVTFTLGGVDAVGNTVSVSCSTTATAATGVAQCALTIPTPGQFALSVSTSAAAGYTASATRSSSISVAPNTQSVVPTLNGGTSTYTFGGWLASASIPMLANLNSMPTFRFSAPGTEGCSAPGYVSGGVVVAACQFLGPRIAGALNLTVSVASQQDDCFLVSGTATQLAMVVDLGALNSKLVDLTALDAASTAAGVAATAASVAATTAEIARARAAEASLNTTLAAEVKRALSAESAASASLVAEAALARSNEAEVRARVAVLETLVATPRPFLFFGLVNALTVSYTNTGFTFGSGATSMFNQLLTFDQQLTAGATAGIRYASGIVTITTPGQYRLDAFVHLVNQATNVVGTGVVAWMSVANVPLGPNILNPNPGNSRINRGTTGDDTIVSTIITTTATPTAPFTCKLVLVSMNQQTAVVTDASTISVTQV